MGERHGRFQKQQMRYRSFLKESQTESAVLRKITKVERVEQAQLQCEILDLGFPLDANVSESAKFVGATLDY